ncbi:hypothetical protein AGMMS50262_15430 [Bacteroidia bacterium]|nr:hypothetical protein AGMMS50262_15430 [Bacteroidia bacterium]
MGRIVIYTNEIDYFLNELGILLFKKRYFSFFEDAEAYVNKLTYYIERYIGILPEKNAPVYFNRYGNNLKYITYRANKTTQWYIFYQQMENTFLVRHITNNHVAAQYLER